MAAVSSREEVVAAFDAFRDAVSGLADLSFDALTTPERLALLERLEHDLRRWSLFHQAWYQSQPALDPSSWASRPRSAN
jgi:hypothetical protein